MNDNKEKKEFTRKCFAAYEELEDFLDGKLLTPRIFALSICLDALLKETADPKPEAATRLCGALHYFNAHIVSDLDADVFKEALRNKKKSKDATNKEYLCD